MQQYIYENPQILSVEELTGNKKLLVLIRELSTNYGHLDGLGIDEAGNVYIIETKLLRNPDRRNISTTPRLWRCVMDGVQRPSRPYQLSDF